MTILNGWENFYVIVGSSAGALIGLQFVVISLLAAKPIPGGDALVGGAFATPSVVHFGVVLLLAAILCAPWNGITNVSVLWGLIGLCGLIYTIVVARRMHVQNFYRPVFEDWLFHFLLPFAAYTVLTISAYLAYFQTRPALFLVGAAALLLLFIGIHNSWDAIMYHVFAGSKKKE